MVWVAGGWNQELGELVTADLGNVSVATLFRNLLKAELAKQADDRLLDQATTTLAVYDGLRADRNDMIHCFFDRDPTNGMQQIKISAKTGKGFAEIKTVPMSKQDIDSMCFSIQQCFESLDDITNKIYFRRKFLAGEWPAPSYEHAVHGWRPPSFDIEPLREYLR